MNAEGTTFECGETSLLVSERCVTGCANRHLWRKHYRSAKVDGVGNEISTARPESRARFEVSPKQERNITHRLQGIELGGNLSRRTNRDREAANLFLLDVLS